MEARIVGTASDIDLALLKVDVAGLRALPFADYDAIRQGELVFAFGSPEGLRNSVTMGVVSSVARQPDPDSATIYIQTDAPINPGNSGGPLVNVDGRAGRVEHVHPVAVRRESGAGLRDSELGRGVGVSRSCVDTVTFTAGFSASACRRSRRRWPPDSACREPRAWWCPT